MLSNTFPFKSEHINTNVKIVTGEYEDGSLAITLVNTETDELECKCTLYIPGSRLAFDEVIIKDYSENEGVVEGLVEAGVIYEPHRFTNVSLPNGFYVPICRLTDKSLGELRPKDWWPDITPDADDDDYDENEIITISRVNHPLDSVRKRSDIY